MVAIVPAIFSVEELWLLQSVIRHEVAQCDHWKYPPCSFDLNEQIADALLKCTEIGIKEAPLLLDLEMCLAIDACVSMSAKDRDSGKMIGQRILLASYKARRDLSGGPLPDASEIDDAAPADMAERLAVHNANYKTPRRRRK